MESDRRSNTPSDGLERVRPLHGRTSGPTRRSTKGQWTPEEDEILRIAVQRFKGKNWKKIAECFKDRTDVQCLHRWQKVLNPELVKGPWSKEEDEVIIDLVNKFGPKKWSTIAQHLPGRIGKQCRERWHNHLNPGINKEAWTQEEELALIRAHQIYGNKWAELTKFLPGRTDNSIKNHWNSSVKKKLDMFLASGLLSQFQGPPLGSHPNQSTASSSSKAQQSSEDDSAVKDGVEGEEVSECSQGSNVVGFSQSTNDMVNTIVQNRGECRVTEQSSHEKDPNSSLVPCSEDYRPAFQETTFSMPEVPCELGGSTKNIEHDFSLDWGTFTGRQLNPNELPEMSLLDLAQVSSGLFMQALIGNNDHETVSLQPVTSMGLSTSTSMGNVVVSSDTPNPIVNSDCRMMYPEPGHEGCCPSENVINRIDGPIDSLHYQPSNFQIPENGTFGSQSCCSMRSDMLGTSLSLPPPVLTQLPPNDGSLIFIMDSNQFNGSSHGNAERESVSSMHNGFVYANESGCFPCDDGSDGMTVKEQQEEANDMPKLVPVNDFGSALSNDIQSGPSLDKNPVVTDEHRDSGVLFYEPPRFPSLDIPFFSCDLIQSGADMQQEYSPLGIRQLMISSMTPFKLWDSPSRDNSPDAVLKSAAKTFTGTPSILKKRHRDLVSPLSEKRNEKKLESDLKQESFSNLTSDFSRLGVMFDDCVDQEGSIMVSSPEDKRNCDASCLEKENLNPTFAERKQEGNGSMAISEGRMIEKQFNSSEALEKMKEPNAVRDVNNKAGGNDAVETVKELNGILVEHDTNDLLFFSPDRFGIKSDRAIGLSAKALGNKFSRRLDAASKHVAILSSSEIPCLSVVCSPRMCAKKDGTKLAMSSSLQSTCSLENKDENSSKGVHIENKSTFEGTPFKINIESPSAWKSPWFINSFLPGPRVDTDITIEDIGYFMSPGDQGYDAIGLMKQLGEQTASAFADAQEILGDETPETILKGKCFTNPEADKENIYSPNCQKAHCSLSTSNVLTERRTLDFSECGTPKKETGNFSSSISFSSPSSYLLKGCR
ncbi:Myb-related protein 3R-1 [Forsythia ovata]|uniref:Myb-related protein 3R-1 n=1 Tax=Forsythia ovata TaxID=205694 RepID=A0ABD1WFE5_9LAMI